MLHYVINNMKLICFLFGHKWLYHWYNDKRKCKRCNKKEYL